MIQNILYYFVLIVIIYLEVVLEYESIFIILIDSSLVINIRFIVKYSVQYNNHIPSQIIVRGCESSLPLGTLSPVPRIEASLLCPLVPDASAVLSLSSPTSLSTSPSRSSASTWPAHSPRATASLLLTSSSRQTSR
jgi:hypothetical protein